MAIKIQNTTVIDDSRNGTLVSLELTGTGALKLPVGTTAQRPSPDQQGHIRFNTDTGTIEGYGLAGNGTGWGAVGGDDALALAIIGL
jgi:hypothetical protein